MEKLLTYEAVMDILGVSRAQVYRMVKMGILPEPLYLTDETPRFQVCDVQEAVAKAVEKRQSGPKAKRPRGKMAPKKCNPDDPAENPVD